MPRKAAGLTAAKVRTAKPGRYCDGNGLWLYVRGVDVRSWVLRFQIAGKPREMGLGKADADGTHGLTLAQARSKAAELHRLVRDGVDPLAKREADEAAARAAAQAAAARRKTFREAADAFIASHDAGWRNDKHRAQWGSTLRVYAFPIFGDMPVGDVDSDRVLAAVGPIWATKPETASRVRQRIERILDFARVRGWRSGENPARWRGHLDHSLPARAKVAKVQHHAALPWRDVAAFLVALREEEGLAARALELTILTAARTGEALGVRWPEIDLDAAIWTVPAARMKAGKEHRVPLSDAALAVLRSVQPLRNAERGDWVFPGLRRGRPLSNMAMEMVLRRMQRGDLTVHGFRSTFRDWAAEATSHQREAVEAALAHTLGNKVETAYLRGDLFAKRRRLMDEWAAFCARPAPSGEVVPLRRANG